MSSNKKMLELLNDLTEIGIALSAEKDINLFFQMVLNAAIKFSNSDAGTIYTLSEDKKSLDFKIICTLSKDLHLSMADTIKWPSVPLYNNQDEKIYKNFATYVAHTKKACKVADAYEQDIFDNSGTKSYDSNNNYRSTSMAAIPMMDHENELLGVIQLINAMNDEGNIVSYTNEHLSTLNSLASQAAIALTNKHLIKDLENLLLQFNKSIAAAIDRKSKYTGGHITRVANLSQMIAEHIQDDKGVFNDVTFSDDELQELNIAGWMHDVGKITTPIYIRDKAKKLETIFDRIELVMTRFELIEILIKQDIQFEQNDQKQVELQDELTKLLDSREFINKVNTGGEFMSEDKLSLIEDIFNYSYKSNGKKYRLITEDEKKNLSIRKGTLLPEEIEKMHDHALVTHEMLSQLSYPKKFKNIPLYAASHHEKLNGKGYPFQKTADELPLQSRILAVADLFEALTASDRPYKKGKTMTETLKIMAFMVKDGEIDKTLVEFLMDSELYLQYAKQYLNPEQIDDVDIDKIKDIFN